MRLYCTIQDLRDRGLSHDQADNASVLKSILQAMGKIEVFCQRDFWLHYRSLEVDGSGKSTLFLDESPIVEVQRLEIDGTRIDAGDFALYGEEGYVKLIGSNVFPRAFTPGTFPEGSKNIAVKGLFGFETVPAEVKEACILVTIDVLRNRESEADVAATSAMSTRNAIGLKRAKIEDISVEFEYPRDLKETSKVVSTGNASVDAMLDRFKRKMHATAV